jgi:hypothetical protein
MGYSKCFLELEGKVKILAESSRNNSYISRTEEYIDINSLISEVKAISLPQSEIEAEHLRT